MSTNTPLHSNTYKMDCTLQRNLFRDNRNCPTEARELREFSNAKEMSGNARAIADTVLKY